IEPPRIAYYPDKILDVITKIPDPSNNNALTYWSTLKKSENQATSEDPLLSLSSLAQSFHNEQSETIKSNLEQIKELLIKAEDKGDQMLKLQLEAKEKDELIISLQHQALDRLAILQKHAEAILVQNFELHEYPIPRLFIIFPVDHTKWNPMNVLGNKFRLHFLCECGNYTILASKSNQNQIHIAKHDGHEIRDSTEFFRKYGKHMLILLQWLRLGMLSAASLVPASPFIDAGINYSIDYIKALSVEYPVLNNINTIDDYEGLEGADLQQLSTFLRSNDEDRKLGNLYRITTEAGHVNWVCSEHYRLTYKEKEQKAFANAVEMNGGKYDQQLGKAVITLGSRTRAEEFFDALANARHCSKADLEAFKDVLKMSSVSTLRLDMEQFQESVGRKLLLLSTRYEILVRIIELRNLKTIHIVLSKDFTNTTLTALDLKSNPIEKEGIMAVAEAFKINTGLTTLKLQLFGIEDIGAPALSEALKINRTLTHLDLGFISLDKKKKVMSLLEAVKVNRTLAID
ncbi:hypothetical protein BX616_006057, partial [Lobosporangium transversale]